jgi:hypothetical protein
MKTQPNLGAKLQIRRAAKYGKSGMQALEELYTFVSYLHLLTAYI